MLSPALAQTSTDTTAPAASTDMSKKPMKAKAKKPSKSTKAKKKSMKAKPPADNTAPKT
jgi:hypothetical protein